MIAGGREINKEYYKFNPIPMYRDASASFIFWRRNKLKIIKQLRFYLYCIINY